MYGWAKRLYDYSVERNKRQRAAEQIGRYTTQWARPSTEPLQEAIDVLERLIKQAKGARSGAAKRAVQALERACRELTRDASGPS